MIWLSIALSGFGLAGLLLVLVRLSRWNAQPDTTPLERWPKIVTQLPLYNESEMVERLLDHVTAMSYPEGLHEVQVLDDSNNGSESHTAQLVERLQAQGKAIRWSRTD
jgi:cellulose synthase/poly-beta-1,6-N-acetylglucosamine synthase-like glycosyltransferase